MGACIPSFPVSTPPVFDCLQYAKFCEAIKTGVEGLGMRLGIQTGATLYNAGICTAVISVLLSVEFGYYSLWPLRFFTKILTEIINHFKNII